MSTCTWTNDGEVWATECGREQESARLPEARFCCFCGSPIANDVRVPHQYPIEEEVILSIDNFINAYRTGTLDAVSIVFIAGEDIEVHGWFSSDVCRFHLLRKVNRQRRWLIGETE